MRTPQETIDRINALEADGSDIWGVERERLLGSLPLQHAQQWLEEGRWTEETWNAQRIRTDDMVRGQIVDYLPYAWAMANALKRPSVLRAIGYFSGLLWLIGPNHDELRTAISPDNEPETVKIEGEKVIDMRPKTDYFGKPALVAVSDALGFNWRAEDNDQWRNSVEEEPVTAEQALQG